MTQIDTTSIKQRYEWKNKNGHIDMMNTKDETIVMSTNQAILSIYKVCQEALTQGMRIKVSGVINEKVKRSWLNWMENDNYK